jgi:hypothetical protein
MFHFVLDWQAGAQAQIEASIGVTDWTTKEVTLVFHDCCRELAQKPKGKTIQTMFVASREKMVHSDEGLQCWVACLALTRTWHDEVKTAEQIERAAWLTSNYGESFTLANISECFRRTSKSPFTRQVLRFNLQCLLVGIVTD